MLELGHTGMNPPAGNERRPEQAARETGKVERSRGVREARALVVVLLLWLYSLVCGASVVVVLFCAAAGAAGADAVCGVLCC